jgi:hypothetical protein
MRFKVAKRLEEVEKVLCSKGDAPEFIAGGGEVGAIFPFFIPPHPTP